MMSEKRPPSEQSLPPYEPLKEADPEPRDEKSQEVSKTSEITLPTWFLKGLTVLNDHIAKDEVKNLRKMGKLSRQKDFNQEELDRQMKILWEMGLAEEKDQCLRYELGKEMIQVNKKKREVQCWILRWCGYSQEEVEVQEREKRRKRCLEGWFARYWISKETREQLLLLEDKGVLLTPWMGVYLEILRRAPKLEEEGGSVKKVHIDQLSSFSSIPVFVKLYFVRFLEILGAEGWLPNDVVA